MRHLSPLTKCVLALVMAGSIGCGDETKPVVNTTEDNPFAACQKFDSPTTSLSTFPGIASGSLDDATATLAVEAGQCGEQIAPYGVETPGPDQVVGLTDLVPGATYVMRLTSVADLALYITSSCSADTVTQDSCMAFVDSSVQPLEKASFVAPADGKAFVVVDYFLASSPLDGSFSLEVYEAECTADDQCGSAGGCVDMRCVECTNSFHCGSADAPICDTANNTCVAGESRCQKDDQYDPMNDGPAGAVDITPTEGDENSIAASVCNNPTSELDFYKFTVADNGEHYSLALDWTDTDEDKRDLELTVYDDTGKVFGASLWQHPETVDLTYLAAGTYYVSVDSFAPTVFAVNTDYTLSVTRTTGQTCETLADCAAEFDTQIFRASCDAGACQFIDGAGTFETGSSCDSNDDCANGQCAGFSFAADADTRAVCAPGCTSDDECGEGFVCTDYLAQNICVAACDNDLQCAVNLGREPTEGAWLHLTCNDTGHCEL